MAGRPSGHLSLANYMGKGNPNHAGALAGAFNIGSETLIHVSYLAHDHHNGERSTGRRSFWQWKRRLVQSTISRLFFFVDCCRVLAEGVAEERLQPQRKKGYTLPPSLPPLQDSTYCTLAVGTEPLHVQGNLYSSGSSLSFPPNTANVLTAV